MTGGDANSGPTCWMRCDATWPDLAWVREQIKRHRAGSAGALEWPATGRHAMVRMLARVIGVGVEYGGYARCKKLLSA